MFSERLRPSPFRVGFLIVVKVDELSDIILQMGISTISEYDGR